MLIPAPHDTVAVLFALHTVMMDDEVKEVFMDGGQPPSAFPFSLFFDKGGKEPLTVLDARKAGVDRKLHCIHLQETVFSPQRELSHHPSAVLIASQTGAYRVRCEHARVCWLRRRITLKTIFQH